MSGRVFRLLLLPALILALEGCGLSGRQREDVARWEAEAVALGHPEAKYEDYLDASKAAGLGFLPFGIGGFYVHRPGLAISGILCWPLSITWLPAVAARSAQQHNYEEFRKRMMVIREATGAPGSRREDPGALLDRIERLHDMGKISEGEYREIRRLLLDRGGRP
jgi:hypothetical protein